MGVPYANGKHPGGKPFDPDSNAGKKRAEAAEYKRIQDEARERILGKVKQVLDAELIDQLVELMAGGNYAETAAQSVGIPPHTFNHWVSEGETQWLEGQQTGEYGTRVDPLALRCELYLRIKEASAQWQVRIVNRLETRIRNNQYWQGDMTFLERRDPGNWGRREVPTRNGKTWEEQVRTWTQDEERKRRARTNAGSATS